MNATRAAALDLLAMLDAAEASLRAVAAASLTPAAMIRMERQSTAAAHAVLASVRDAHGLALAEAAESTQVVVLDAALDAAARRVEVPRTAPAARDDGAAAVAASMAATVAASMASPAPAATTAPAPKKDADATMVLDRAALRALAEAEQADGAPAAPEGGDSTRVLDRSTLRSMVDEALAARGAPDPAGDAEVEVLPAATASLVDDDEAWVTYDPEPASALIEDDALPDDALPDDALPDDGAADAGADALLDLPGDEGGLLDDEGLVDDGASLLDDEGLVDDEGPVDEDDEEVDFGAAFDGSEDDADDPDASEESWSAYSESEGRVDPYAKMASASERVVSLDPDAADASDAAAAPSGPATLQVPVDDDPEATQVITPPPGALDDAGTGPRVSLAGASAGPPRPAAIQLGPDGGATVLGADAHPDEDEALELGDTRDYGEAEDELDDDAAGILGVGVVEYEDDGEYEEIDEAQEEEERQAAKRKRGAPQLSDDECGQLFEQALKAAGRDMSRGVLLLGDVLDADPGRIEAYLRRGRLRLDLGDFAGAASDFLKAEDLEERSPRVLTAVGDLYYTRKDYGKAVAQYTEALRHDAAFAPALSQRGMAHFFRRQYAQCIEDLEQAKALDPALSYVDTYIRRARKRT